jgi:hypothetical protein
MKTNYLTKIIFMTVLFSLFLTAGGLTPVNKASAEESLKQPEFSVPAGLYTEEFDLTITAKDSSTIYYTIDGSIPVAGATTTHAYTAPIRITAQAVREQTSTYFCGTVIRAIAVGEDGTKSNVATASYFVDSNMLNRYKLPIISITTDSANLYDSEIGIMAPFRTQYRGKEWERPIHFEYFNKEGKLQISMDAGIRLHGAASRDWAFKSFRIYARSEYDKQDQFEYDFFANSVIPATVKNGEDRGEDITEFKHLILRNGGNEGTAGDGTLFRDALSQALMANTTLDLQGYAPAITFINGEFYGIHNIRERQDEKYIEDHYNVDENEVVIYEFYYDEAGAQEPVIVNGEDSDLAFYNSMLDFLRNNDMSVQKNYEKLKEYLDIENFADYQIINIFGANRDWPGNNCKAWRARTEYNPEAEYGLDGRLRWLVYDTDFNFGLYNPWAVSMDSLADATKTGGTEWPTQDGATLILRKLLENEEFKTYFCQRFLDLINTNYDKDYANTLIDQMAVPYENAISDFKLRYGLMGDWNQNIQTVKDFITGREAVVKSQLCSKFKLGKLYFLSIHTMDGGKPVGGKVNVNTVTITKNSPGVKDGLWKKSYYDGLPTLITAVPEEGYEFVSWSGATDSKEVTIDASKLAAENSLVELTPIFQLADIVADNTDSAIKNDSGAASVEGQNSPAATATAQTGASADADKNGDTAIYLVCIIVLVLIILIMGIYLFLKNRKEHRQKD